MGKTEVHYRACNLCEAICGLEINVEDGRIVSIRGDEKDPFSRGHLCPKAVALQDIHQDPDRLRHPMRRTAEGWTRIGWREAFDLAAERIHAVQQQYGNDAMAFYFGNPNVHNYGSMLFGLPFMRALKTRNRFSATSVDQLPHQLAAHLMFGHQFLIPIPDVDRTDFFLIMGANPAASNGSLMTAPGIKKRIKEVSRRGGKVVVVDPRFTETSKLADEHNFVRPGSDALLLFAMIHTVFEEGLGHPGHLASHLRGVETLREAARSFSPERVAEATGLAADDIRRLTREFCAAEAAVCYGRIGLSIQSFGSLCQWLINALNLLTGNIDRPGGAMFTRPAVDLLDGLVGRGSHGRWTSRVRGLPEVGGELPVAVLAEEILTPGDGQIRGLVTSAGNPVLSTPNGRQLDRALASLEFMVSIDFYINETTRHADLILPPTAALEHDHYDLVFHALAVRNTSRYSEALFEPEEDTRHDWQIFRELQIGLLHCRGEDQMSGKIKQWWMRRLRPATLLDFLLRRGPHGAGINPLGDGLTLKRLRKLPHGVDLGALEPCLPERLVSETIDLAPSLLMADVERLKQTLKEETPPIVLIGRRHVRSNNSWMHNVPRLMRGKDRCTLLLHPEDAAHFGITHGHAVRIRSCVGEIVAPAEVTDKIMPGVVSLPHGWGHDRKGVELATARERPGVSLNDLTDDLRVDPVSGNAALNGLAVEIEALSSPNS